MSASDRDRTRRIVVDAARVPRADSWPAPWLVAATMAAAVVIGVTIGSRLPRFEPQTASVPAPPLTRQLQFETPGGTRVIWILNPEFDLGKDPAP